MLRHPMRPFSLLVVLLATLAIPIGSHAQNAYLTNGFLPRFIKAGVNYPISVRVRNTSTTPLITFRVDWRWGNGAVQTGNWQSTTGISGNQYWPYDHPIPLNQTTEGPGVLKVWVVGNGDTDQTNDTLTFPSFAIQNWVTKTMLLEQWTATWCVNCPPANIVGNFWESDDQVVVAKHHADDEFSVGSSTDYYDQFGVDFTPAGVIDNGEYGDYAANAAHTQWGSELEQRKLGVSPVLVEVGTEYDALTRELTVELDATYTYAVAGEHTLNAYIVEDDIPGAQANAQPGYIHQQLVREVLGGNNGTAGIVPSGPVPGTAYSATWTYQLPEDWNAEKVRVLGMATHHQDGSAYTLNTVSSAPLVVGVEELGAAAIEFQLHPNPATDMLWLTLPADAEPAQVQVLSADGRVVLAQRVRSNGAHVLVEGFDSLASGPYLVRVQRGDAIGERRVVKR